MAKFLAQRGRPHVSATLCYLGRDESFEVEQIDTEYERIESLAKLT